MEPETSSSLREENLSRLDAAVVRMQGLGARLFG